ncbi:MAG TPA: phosphotransferase family protein [Acidimicrobiales bacterium]|nr:phosphotransferase family protein [Acidimicrobiales bacterium]
MTPRGKAGVEEADEGAGAHDSAGQEDERTRGLVDEARLADFLDEHGVPGTGEELHVRFITGGASNELFEVRRGGHRMALRRPPRVVPEGRNDTMLREYRLLAALRDTDVPHARAVAVCDDPSLMGGCFYLMEFVEGWSPLGGGGWPAPFDTDLDARRGLGFQLVDGIAKLATVDWRARGLEGFGRPDGFHERQVDRWMAHLAAVQFRPIPGLETAAEWLRTHRPRGYEPGIMHGDYQFANVMFGHGAPARLAAIVDWEMATVGDPLLDLGWVVQGWVDDDSERSTGSYVDYTGMPTRSEILEYYARESGRDVSEIDYYVVLARFKLAVVLEGGYARVVQGKADNPKMEAFGPIVLDLAQKAADLAQTSTRR